ncbi:MAG: hypothetical protein V3V00_09145 [Saprospiraceae bacterium]
MKNILSSFILFSFPLSLVASDSDFYRSTGKIYGVYGVLLILLIGLIIYLFSIEKKLNKIERNLDNE